MLEKPQETNRTKTLQQSIIRERQNFIEFISDLERGNTNHSVVEFVLGEYEKVNN